MCRRREVHVVHADAGAPDHAAPEARWGFFVVGGKPGVDPGAQYHRATSDVGWLSCPDNCAFDSRGRIWVSEWLSGNVSMHDPAAKSWRTWKLPGDKPRCYAVWVDEKDMVWLAEWAANAMYRFDPASEKFERHAMPRAGANVRQIHGRPGEVWGAASGVDMLVVVR